MRVGTDAMPLPLASIWSNPKSFQPSSRRLRSAAVVKIKHWNCNFNMNNSEFVVVEAKHHCSCGAPQVVVPDKLPKLQKGTRTVVGSRC